MMHGQKNINPQRVVLPNDDDDDDDDDDTPGNTSARIFSVKTCTTFAIKSLRLIKLEDIFISGETLLIQNKKSAILIN